MNPKAVKGPIELRKIYFFSWQEISLIPANKREGTKATYTNRLLFKPYRFLTQVLSGPNTAFGFL